MSCQSLSVRSYAWGVAKRTYGQYCALAHTLDVVGDRWTLLVIRELLSGPKRYTDLLEALPGIGTSLLIQRLRGLDDDGIVARRRLPPPAASDVYELTPSGRELGDALIPLVLWGARHRLGARQPGEAFRAEWPLLAFQAVVDPARTVGLDAVYQFDLDESTAHLRIHDGRISAHPGTPADPPDVTVAMSVEAFVDIGVGRTSPADEVAAGHVHLDGDPAAVQTLLQLVNDAVT